MRRERRSNLTKEFVEDTGELKEPRSVCSKKMALSKHYKYQKNSINETAYMLTIMI